MKKMESSFNLHRQQNLAPYFYWAQAAPICKYRKKPFVELIVTVMAEFEYEFEFEYVSFVAFCRAVPTWRQSCALQPRYPCYWRWRHRLVFFTLLRYDFRFRSRATSAVQSATPTAWIPAGGTRSSSRSSKAKPAAARGNFPASGRRLLFVLGDQRDPLTISEPALSFA